MQNLNQPPQQTPQPNDNLVEVTLAHEYITEVSIIALDRENILGKPTLNLAFSSNLVTGIQLTFESPKSEEKHMLFSYMQKAGTSIGRVNNLNLKIKISLIEGDVNNSFNKHLIKKIKRGILNRIAIQHYTKELISLPILIPLKEFYSIVIGVVETYNYEVTKKPNFQSDLRSSSNPSKLENDKLKILESLYTSIIYQKKIWWLNIASTELPITQKGIMLGGEYYQPLEFEDKQALQTFPIKTKIRKATVYPDPLDPSTLYWVNNMLLIPLRKCERSIISMVGQSLTNKLNYQTKTTTTMKSLKVNSKKNLQDRTAVNSERALYRSESQSHSLSKLITSKALWNCDYFLNRYLAL